jgi:hypothetical protein
MLSFEDYANAYADMDGVADDGFEGDRVGTDIEVVFGSPGDDVFGGTQASSTSSARLVTTC